VATASVSVTAMSAHRPRNLTHTAPARYEPTTNQPVDVMSAQSTRTHREILHVVKTISAWQRSYTIHFCSQ